MAAIASGKPLGASAHRPLEAATATAATVATVGVPAATACAATAFAAAAFGAANVFGASIGDAVVVRQLLPRDLDYPIPDAPRHILVVQALKPKPLCFDAVAPRPLPHPSHELRAGEPDCAHCVLAGGHGGGRGAGGRIQNLRARGSEADTHTHTYTHTRTHKRARNGLPVP